MAWPTKTNFVDGDVLNASQMNNIGTNLNLYDPTSATNGQVPIANGSGSVAFGSLAMGGMTSVATGNLATVSTLTLNSIPQTYKKLVLYLNDYRLTTSGGAPSLRANNNSGTVYQQTSSVVYSTAVTQFGGENTQLALSYYGTLNTADQQTVVEIDQYTQLSYHSITILTVSYTSSGYSQVTRVDGGFFPANQAVTRLDILTPSYGPFTQGTYTLYGVN